MWKTFLFTIFGGAAQLASQAIANSVTQTGRIDWSHVGTASIIGAVTTVAALHTTKPGQDTAQ